MHSVAGEGSELCPSAALLLPFACSAEAAGAAVSCRGTRAPGPRAAPEMLRGKLGCVVGLGWV